MKNKRIYRKKNKTSIPPSITIILKPLYENLHKKLKKKNLIPS